MTLKLCPDLNSLLPPHISPDCPVERVVEHALVKRFYLQPVRICKGRCGHRVQTSASRNVGESRWSELLTLQNGLGTAADLQGTLQVIHRPSERRAPFRYKLPHSSLMRCNRHSRNEPLLHTQQLPPQPCMSLLLPEIIDCIFCAFHRCFLYVTVKSLVRHIRTRFVPNQ